MEERKLPPISELCTLTMVLVILGGIYVASKLPREVPLGIPIALTAIAAAVLVVSVVLLTRLPDDFAWDNFRLVAGYSLLAYVAIAGILEFTFLRNHTPDDVMVLLTAQLFIYAVNIPVLLGFSVARYQTPSRATA
ncbi:MAG TPA: hypothetical protein VI759_08665 [Dehalococcoidia bacterium]|nr:hypothetical protein [Dehalococcoidia bacterium]